MFDPATVVIAASIFEIVRGLVDDIVATLQGVAIAAVIAFVLFTAFKTRAAVPILGAILLGAFVLWGVNNTDFLQETATEAVNEANN